MPSKSKRAVLIFLWPACAALIAWFAWIQLERGLDKELRQAEQRAQHDVISLGRNYAATTERFLQNIDQLALHVQFEWELTQGRMNLAGLYERGLFTSDPLINITILDRDGHPVTSTHPYDPATSLAREQYFLAHRRGEADALYIDQPAVSRLFHFPTIEFSRNLSGPKRGFEGIVLVSVSPTYFTDGYDIAVLEQHGLLALADEQHRLLAARSGTANAQLGTRFMDVPPDVGSGGVSLLPGGQFADGRERYVGWQRIADFNVIAFAGVDRAEVLAPFQRSRDSTYQHALYGAAALIIATALAMYATYTLQRRKHQMEEVRAAYRLATERGNEGFYILRPVWGAKNQATDFTFIDCNKRGADLYGLAHRELLGRNLSSLLSPESLAVELTRLQSALDSGYLEEETHVGDGLPMRGEWLHRRVVRSGGELAITASDISERKAHVRELERKGYEDALTGLTNRHWLHDFLPPAIEHARSEGNQLALMYVDLDHFKRINDGMGHNVGDELLRHCASRLVDLVRPGDKVVRLGGDEFLVLLAKVDGNEGAQRVAERIASALNEKFRLSQSVLNIGASIGISLFPGDGSDAETLLHKADMAMYFAKTSGRRQWRFYDPHFDEEIKSRLQREKELARAIEAEEFTVFYQPRLDVHTQQICSMEALVRWQHPQRGIIAPNEFIPLAEETGQIIALGEMVMRQVFAQMAQWTAEGREVVPVSINVSARQFNETDVTALLASAFAHYPIDPELIEVELTESSMTGDVSDVSRTIAAIQKMGVKVLVDDFGTGYSSLAQLQKLDMDVLKVDRAFTLEIERGRGGRVFFSAIITMAHALDMRVVAEGVENAAQMDILKDLDCDEIQGYFVSHPLAAEALQDFLRRIKDAPLPDVQTAGSVPFQGKR